jgi:RNA polymerase sigma factor (sigma-70 family)
MGTTSREDALSVDSPDDGGIATILRGLATRTSGEAWAAFLRAYAPLILGVARLFGRNADQVDEVFLFVCEGLARDGFRRLRRFEPAGPARFSTWLYAVARNLCRDWHRREWGRQRVFESVAHLSGLDREVFRHVFEEGLPLEEALLPVRRRFPTASREELEESCRRIDDALSPRQRWLLGSRRPRLEPLDALGADEEPRLRREVPDPGPNPEALAVQGEARAALACAFARLPEPDRLLIRLRFGQGLTLEQVARLTGSGSAQAVDHRVREVLKHLRKEMTAGPGKGHSPAV